MAFLLVESSILDRSESGTFPLSTALPVPPKLGAVGRAWVGSVSSWRLSGAVS
jgi:hypothetical protein